MSFFLTQSRKGAKRSVQTCLAPQAQSIVLGATRRVGIHAALRLCVFA
jgi:hypothetical protein